MNFVADECCDAPLVDGLRQDRHDVIYIREVAAGTDDESVLRLAASQQRILLTEDKDFGELVVRLGLPARGIVLLRMDPADTAGKLSRLRAVMKTHAHRFAGAFVVIEKTRTRIRPL